MTDPTFPAELARLVCSDDDTSPKTRARFLLGAALGLMTSEWMGAFGRQPSEVEWLQFCAQTFSVVQIAVVEAREGSDPIHIVSIPRDDKGNRGPN